MMTSVLTSSRWCTPVADPNKPLEVVRTIHSFDPCMACAVHVVDADGNEVVSVKVL